MDKIHGFNFSNIYSVSELIETLKSLGVNEKDYWLYYGLYQERIAREKCIPLSGTFELTPLCNLDCKMCYVHLDSDQLNEIDLLTVAQWKEIMTQAHSMGMLNATLTGGECLMYPGFDDIYIFLRTLGIKASIKTNGLLLTKDRIDFFNDYPPRSLSISLYGSSNETYQNVTGHAVFDYVYNNLLQLKEVPYPVSISITPSLYMYSDMEQIIDLVKRIKIPFSINIMLIPPRKETGRQLCDLSIDQYAKIFKMVMKDKYSNVAPIEQYEAYDYKMNENAVIRCGAGRSCFTVEWNGLLTSCSNLNSMKIDLLHNDFTSSWRKINLDTKSFAYPYECLDCKYDKICYNCVAYRCNGAPKGHCNRNVCERTKLFIQEGIYPYII